MPTDVDMKALLRLYMRGNQLARHPIVDHSEHDITPLTEKKAYICLVQGALGPGLKKALAFSRHSSSSIVVNPSIKTSVATFIPQAFC